jgi:hypothetical protein
MSEPTPLQIYQGKDYTGSAALASGSEIYQNYNTIDEQTPITSLSSNYSVKISWVLRDIDGNYSNVSTSDTITGSTLIKLRPVEDILIGAWTPSTGTNLYEVLDESTYDDADYITTTQTYPAEVKFGSATDPGVNANHTIYYRAKGTGTMEARLYQGTTLISTHTPTLTSEYQTFTWAISEAEAANITDYSDLRVRFIGS